MLELSLPAYPWAVTIPAAGFVKERDETAADGTMRRPAATNPDTGVSILGFLEQSGPRTTSVGCREQYGSGFSRRLDLGKDGMCGSLDVSRPRLTAGDEAAVGRLVEGARIVARP